MKKAILQVSDTGPLESLVVMLRSVGYECFLPTDGLQDHLRALGCDAVFTVRRLVAKWGYDPPMDLPLACVHDLDDADLFVDIKAHRNGPRVWKAHKNLEKKTLWYRINGGRPEHVVNYRGDMGDEVNPPCPVLTPNQWYRGCALCDWTGKLQTVVTLPGANCGERGQQGCLCRDKFYCCWPPFVRWDEHQLPRTSGHGNPFGATEKVNAPFDPPMCLVHNLSGWGYGPVAESFREMGIRLYGLGSPDGLLLHREVPTRLGKALAMVHCKNNDAPGYAIYEAMASACPVVCTRTLIWNCRMGELLVPEQTCLVWGRETHEGISDDDLRQCTREVADAISWLSRRGNNVRLGEAGRKRLRELMWSADRPADVASLAAFMERNFGK